MQSTCNKKSGFTLAETLLTLTMVGVVAAVTIPVLQNTLQDLEIKSAAKKSYSDVANAIKRVVADKGGSFGNVYQNNRDSLMNDVIGYLSYTKVCYTNSGAGECWHNPGQWYYYDSDPVGSNWASRPRAVLSSGALFGIMPFTNPPVTRGDATNAFGEGAIDSNGFKGPNKVGKDIFVFFILDDGRVLPQGAIPNDATTIGCPGLNGDGWGCSLDLILN